MSPFPTEMTDRWENRPDPRPDIGAVYWHMLVGGNSTVAATAIAAQRLLAGFPELHMTPQRWLHVTVLCAGTTNEIGRESMYAMLKQARESVLHIPPAQVEIGRIIYHPEAIMLAVTPRRVLQPVLEAVQTATRTVTGTEGFVNGGTTMGWTPHITVCYSTARQPAEPVITALGKSIGTRDIIVDTFSLVVQWGSERLWDWELVGTISLMEKD